MAGNIKGITIEFRGDTTKLSKALREIRKEGNTLDRELGKIDKALKFNPSSVTLWKQKQEVLTQEISASEKKLEELKAAQKQMDASGVDRTEAEYRELEREIEVTESKLKDFKRELKTIGSPGLKAVSEKLNQVGDKLVSTGEKMSQAGSNLTRSVTVPILGIGAAAVKTTADFDSSMSEVLAISGATGDEFADLQAKAREMGASTKFSAAESADAMKYMALAGWEAEEMMGGLEGVLNLAAAGGSDLATTSDIVTDSLTAFGMTAQDSAHFADVMATAMSRSNTTTEMLGEAFKYAAPVAGAMGYSVEDVSIALGLMANAGIKGSTAGTTLRNVFTRMAKPTKEVQQAMDVLGVSLDDGNGNMLSFKEVMDQLRGSFGQLMIPQEEFTASMAQLDAALEAGEMSEAEYNKATEQLIERAYGAEGAEKAKYASMLAGQRGMAGLLAIVNTTAEEYDGLADSIYNADGAAKEMAEIMLDNLGGQFTILKSQLQEMAISFGEVLVPVIRDVVGKIQEWVDKLNSMDEDQRRQILLIAGVVAAIGPLLFIIGKVITMVGMVSKALSFLAAHPIVLAIAALIAIGVLLYKNWDKICEWAKKLWDNIKKYFEKIKKSITDAFNKAKDAVVKAWNNIKTTITNAVNKVKTTVKTGFDNAKTAIVNAGTKMKDAVVKTWNNIKTSVTNALEKVKTNVKNGFNAVKTTVSTAGENIKTAVSKTWNKVDSITGGALTNLKTIITKAFTAITNVIKNVLGSYINIFTTAWNGIKNTIQTTLNNIKTIITNIFNAIKALFRGDTEAMKGYMTAAWNAIKKTVSDAVNGIKTTITNVFNAIKSFISTALNGWKTVISTVWTSIKSVVSTAVNGVKTTITNVFNGIKTTASNIWNGIKTAITSPIETAKTTISKVVTGIKNLFKFDTLKTNVEKAFDKIKDAITKPINKARDLVKSAIETIKGIFPLKLGKIFDGIKLPHFKISGGKAPWGIGGQGTKPSISIDWYAKGGIFKRPTIFATGGNWTGVGEAGAEAVLPLDSLWSHMAEMGSGIVQNVNANTERQDYLLRRMIELQGEMLDELRKPKDFKVDGRWAGRYVTELMG